MEHFLHAANSDAWWYGAHSTRPCCYPAVHAVPYPPLPVAAAAAGAGRLHDWVVQVREDIAQSFIPRKDDVTEDYWEWLRWRLGQVCLLFMEDRGCIGGWGT